MNPVVGHLPVRVDFQTIWFPTENVRNQDAHLGYEQNNFTLSLPLWQDDCNEWSASTHVRAESFQTHAILPDTQQPFPSDLWNVHFGTGYRHLFDNGWIGGGNVSVGSASDMPFHSVKEMTVAATAFVRIPQGEHNAWLLSLNYSSNSEVLNGIPIPGVAYFYAPTEWFQATIGIPFASATIRPTDDLTLQLTYALLTTFHTRVIYRVLPRLRVYAGFDTMNESYYRVGRLDDRDRLFYYDKQVSGGLLLPLSRQTTIDLSGGYCFDRFYFEGHKSTDRGFNRIDVGDGPFVALRVDYRF